MAKEPSVPGEQTPPELQQQVDPPPAAPEPEVPLEAQVASLTSLVQQQSQLIKALMDERAGKKKAPAPAELPTYQEALKQSRATGKGVLSRDGWVVFQAPAAPVPKPA